MASFIENQLSRPTYLFTQEIEKMKKGELLLEDILNNNDIVQDLKINPNSPFLYFFTNEIIFKLIDYSLKMPKNNDYKIGYKFPFNATEILCSTSQSFQDKLLYEEKNENMNFFKTEVESKQKNEENNDKNNPNYEIRHNIIDYIFNFLNESNSENNSNYLLVGYFNKILINLIEIHNDKILNYIYDYPDKNDFNIISLLIKHMNRKGICEIIQKLLLYENSLIKDLENKKISLIQKLLNELKSSNDILKYEFIINTLCNSLTNKSFFCLFMKNNNLVQILFELSNNINKNKDIYNINLYININENILKNLERKYTPDIYRENKNSLFNFLEKDENNSIDEDINYIINESMIKNILNILFNILKKNEFNFLNDLNNYNNNKNKNCNFISTYERKQKKLGMKILLQVEYIRSLLDLLVNSYASNFYKKDIKELIIILNNNKIFHFLHEIFFKFPFCNIFQIYYSQMIDIITNIYTPDYLANYFILDNNNNENNKSLLSSIIEHIMKKSVFIFNSKRKALNPCLTYEINIINQLINCNNDTVQSLIEKDENLQVFNEVLAGDLNKIINSKLLYNDNNENEKEDNLSKQENDTLYFGKKNLFDFIKERKAIYIIYKNGGDYKKALNEKNDNENKNNSNDDIESDDNEKDIDLNEIEVLDEPIFEIKEKYETENEINNKEENKKNKEKGNSDIKIDINDNENKKNDINIYNDCNFWNIKFIFKEKDINSILNDLE